MRRDDYDSDQDFLPPNPGSSYKTMMLPAQNHDRIQAFPCVTNAESGVSRPSPVTCLRTIGHLAANSKPKSTCFTPVHFSFHDITMLCLTWMIKSPLVLLTTTDFSKNPPRSLIQLASSRKWNRVHSVS